MSAWIETATVHTMSTGGKSRTLMSAWIETVSPYAGKNKYRVALS